MMDFEFEEKADALQSNMVAVREEYISSMAELLAAGMELIQEAPNYSSASRVWGMMEYQLHKKRMPLSVCREIMKRVKWPQGNKPWMEQKAKLELIRKNALGSSQGETGWD